MNYAYAYMTDELEKLAAKKKSRWFHLTTPGQAKRVGKFTEKVVRKPSTLRKVPGFLAKSVGKGLKAGFKEKGILPKAWTGLLVADPILTARRVSKSPGMPAKEKGRSIGEALGGSLGFLAAHRAPFLGQVGASIAGSAIGSRIGKGIGSLVKKKPKTPKTEG